MRPSQLVPVLAFVGVMLLGAYFVRTNFFFTFPILEHSRLFFQLLVAAAVLALLRNALGVTTFAVFGPMIIAIVLLQAGPIWGMVLFFNVFLIAYATRIVFDPFKLPGTHRVAIVITTVGVYISLIEIVGEFYHIKPLEFSTLFPILITSWLADRFVNEGKERGWHYPFNKFLWTSLAVLIAYAAMSYEPLIDFVVRNPETWVGLILLNLLFGTRVRFRLSEFYRFRSVNSRDDVLAMNVRNRAYIEEHNPREIFPQTEKAPMRERLSAAGVPTPTNLFVAKDKRQLGDWEGLLRTLQSFVVKPSQGYGGEGILIIKGRNSESYVTADGRRLSLAEVTKHIAQILDGEYSNSDYDTAIIEPLIVPSEFFSQLCPSGLPDVRIIAFQGFPIMTMIRAPTTMSRGKANLHMGAVGIGVKLCDGRTFQAFHQGRITERHPDTGVDLIGLEVPEWRSLLEIGCRAQAASGLGYAGVDLVVDRERGPLVLEVNKRPGLAIQVVNGHGLASRLRFVEARLAETGTLAVGERVSAAMSWAPQEWGEPA